MKGLQLHYSNIMMLIPLLILIVSPCFAKDARTILREWKASISNNNEKGLLDEIRNPPIYVDECTLLSPPGVWMVLGFFSHNCPFGLLNTGISKLGGICCQPKACPKKCKCMNGVDGKCREKCKNKEVDTGAGCYSKGVSTRYRCCAEDECTLLSPPGKWMVLGSYSHDCPFGSLNTGISRLGSICCQPKACSKKSKCMNGVDGKCRKKCKFHEEDTGAGCSLKGVGTGCKCCAKDHVTKCEEGALWKKECNWCHCRNGVAVCSKADCTELPDTIDSEVECKGTSKFKKDCNWCSCLDGTAMCTQKTCLLEAPPRPDNIECGEGARWKKDCNWCYCRKGLGVCSKAACSSSEYEGESEPECSGTGEFKIDCNWCYCQDSKALCTRKPCMSEPEDDLSPLKDESSSLMTGRPHPHDLPCPTESKCRNGVDGKCRKKCKNDEEDTGARCTLDGVRTICKCCAGVRLVPGLQCMEGAIWRIKCNWCTCSNGKRVCEKYYCQQFPTTEWNSWPECKRQSKFKKECNWCICREGTAVCDRKRCLGVVADDLSPLTYESSSLMTGRQQHPHDRRTSSEEEHHEYYQGLIPPSSEEGYDEYSLQEDWFLADEDLFYDSLNPVPNIDSEWISSSEEGNRSNIEVSDEFLLDDMSHVALKSLAEMLTLEELEHFILNNTETYDDRTKPQDKK